MKEKKIRWILFTTVLMVIFFLLGRTLAYFVEKEGNPFTNGKAKPTEYQLETEESIGIQPLKGKNGKQIKLLLDAGHGGADPGKVGINGALEKDINLSIVEKLAKKLEECGIDVYLTRDSDDALGNGKKGNEKITDLNCRIQMMTEVNPLFTISIHQNSYTKESVCGPQVFYRDGETEGKKMAQVLQTTLIEMLQPEKQRECKGNMSYYLLKKATVPTVIVECGFLSNQKEADQLNTDQYQEKIAGAIMQGILKYIMEYEQ